MGGKIWLTSDLHFCHDRAFLWQPRGFPDVKTHNEQIVSNWNSVVAPEDIVYVLGDIMLNDNQEGMNCLSQLNGSIKIIRGNHDTDVRWGLYSTLPNVETIGWSTMIKYQKYNFYLSHFPVLTSNLEKSPHLREHILNLYGHTHQKDNFYQDNFNMFHVGLDSHNCCPILLDNILSQIQEKFNKYLDKK